VRRHKAALLHGQEREKEGRRQPHYERLRGVAGGDASCLRVGAAYGQWGHSEEEKLPCEERHCWYGWPDPVASTFIKKTHQSGEKQEEICSTDLNPQETSLLAELLHARLQPMSQDAGAGQGGVQAKQTLLKHPSPAERPEGMIGVSDAAMFACISSKQCVQRSLVLKMHQFGSCSPKAHRLC